MVTTHILKEKRDKQETGKENVEKESTVDNLQMEVQWCLMWPLACL
jgi:hypothetical protein